MLNAIKFYFLLAILAVSACKRVPLTGRAQLNMVSDGELASLSQQQYSEFLTQNRVIKSSSQAQLVQQVGKKMAAAVEDYLRQNRYTEMLDQLKWEFNLVESKDVNAWCMPGGKVVVYSGIMPIAKDEAGLAVIMGHEIAHAVARHGNERMSQGLLAQLGGVALSVAVSQKPAEVQQLYMAAFGAGAQLGVLLPFSRLHESEADKLGLVFMSKAGYDPEAAVGFWQRMSALNKQSPPEFLSTHPSDQRRIEEINAYLPIARKYKP